MENRVVKGEEAASWDDAAKKKNDRKVVSFEEPYEKKYFEKSVREILDEKGKSYNNPMLAMAHLKCWKKYSINHPREEMLACVLGEFGISIDE